MSDTTQPMRWDPYILDQGNEFDMFWKDHLGQRRRNVLMIVGRGFDVRACDAAQRVVAAGVPARATRGCYVSTTGCKTVRSELE